MKKLLIAVLILGFSAFAQAQERRVHVNGERLTDDVIASFDNLAGVKLADGCYWFDQDLWRAEYSTPAVIGYVPGLFQLSDEVCGLDETANSSVVSGANCGYVSAGGATVRVCK